ncbi:MAG: acyl-CoA dehydrogenase family protein [Novosphingobium sp.]|jgi:alkylation response protein AidB-like acyl-CoA dehydrogenase|uniref:acyl-CoA dehydrogenase family protein n=1 Tax=Novosphingobium sp. TaxID=1874826 RepID=UPI0039197009
MLALETYLSDDDHAFRNEVRAFLEAELDADLRHAASLSTSVFHEPEVSLAWQKKLHARGWVAPDWPRQFGGTGWNQLQRYVFALECALAGAPSLSPMGLKMVAPVIMHYGNDKQRAHYLPRLLAGEDYWCQGFSEPGSGSDLASVKLRAAGDDDHYVLNGSKIWTTHAHHANRMFALVRTSSMSRPQAGISFLLIDMASPGITVRPIINMSGHHDFNQVFFDNVCVPKANRLGEENDGWSVAKYLLNFERGGKYAPQLRAYLNRIEAAARASDWSGHPGNAEALDREAATIEALCAIELKAMTGSANPAEAATGASKLKIMGTECSQRLDRLAMKVVGWSGMALPLANETNLAATALARFLNNRASTIYAGSNEIQRDIVAKALLAG